MKHLSAHRGRTFGLFVGAGRLLLLAGRADGAEAAATGHGSEVAHVAPHLIWTLPFILLLLAIAILPLIAVTMRWWHSNRNRLLVSIALSLVTCGYYVRRGSGFHDSEPGLSTLWKVLDDAILVDYIPFIVLLFSLYTISGGIRLSGDVPAHPLTNTLILFIGALAASLIGTTGASMVLIRPLLQINSDRKYVKHTVIFFIFLVSNIGGALLPVGDPPLFLGYLRGVPFLWTLHLIPQWLTCCAILLVMYWIFDTHYYRLEKISDIRRDERRWVPIKLEGGINFMLLAGVVLAVALLVPGKELFGTSWVVPAFFREFVQLGLAGISVAITSRRIREANQFNYYAIAEVAALFVGIFITMQVPIEILKIRGAELGLDAPLHYFWVTGLLSSLLDNAPTYVVFFEAAGSMSWPDDSGSLLTGVQTATGSIPIDLLAAISLGAVFMGANTYIGNGPNFLVKSIAESRGVKMPSFFGYMRYSLLILMPVFALITWIFLI